MAATGGAKHVAKKRFWDAVLEAAAARLHEPFLFAGAWNTGAHGLDEKGKTFVCAEHFRVSPLWDGPTSGGVTIRA